MRHKWSTRKMVHGRRWNGHGGTITLSASSDPDEPSTSKSAECAAHVRHKGTTSASHICHAPGVGRSTKPISCACDGRKLVEGSESDTSPTRSARPVAAHEAEVGEGSCSASTKNGSLLNARNDDHPPSRSLGNDDKARACHTMGRCNQ